MSLSQICPFLTPRPGSIQRHSILIAVNPIRSTRISKYLLGTKFPFLGPMMLKSGPVVEKVESDSVLDRLATIEGGSGEISDVVTARGDG